MADECVECRRGLDHCHGALVVHGDGGLECTAADCADVDPARHRMVMDCWATLPGCCVPDTAVLAAYSPA
jgi:hypothetical protein